MADKEQVALLRRGVAAWNAWRRKNPRVEVDLVGADLYAPFSQGRTMFFSLDLSGADLSEANLQLAKLDGVSLNGARLVGANVFGASLIETLCRGTNLSEVDLGETVFGNTDLSGAVGLNDCEFWGPCYIDFQTIARSWPLPTDFLRGCGLPDDYIEYLPSLLARSFEFYSCFISYSTNDDDFAQRLHADLQDNGVRCWFAPEDLKIGDRIRVRLDESIRLHDKLLLIISETAMASQWIEQEVETALRRERRENSTVLFPIRLDDAVMERDDGWPAYVRDTRHIGDFRRWKEHDAYRVAFHRLLRDLKAETGAAE